MEDCGVPEDTAGSSTIEKKPFNKRKWREQKYNKHKKIEQWQEKRKKAALHKYRKVLRKEFNVDTSQIPRQRIDDRNQKMNRYEEAKQEYERICREREEKKQEALRQKAEREAARERYQAMRKERQKKLAKRTRKGQPIMKERLELLLEKIEKMQ